MTEYERWLAYPLEDEDLAEELRAVAGKPEKISDRFYKAWPSAPAGCAESSGRVPTE